LFACLAVSHGAFARRNLVQEAKPLLNQAQFNIRLAVRTDSVATTLAEALQAHIQAILAQIQTGISTVTEVWDDLLVQLQAAQQQFLAAGGDDTQVSEAVTTVVQVMLGIFPSLPANQKGLFDWFGSFDLSAVVAAIQEHVAGLVSQVDIQAAAHQVLVNMGMSEAMSGFIMGHLSGFLGQERGLFDGLFGQAGTFGTQIQAALQSIIAAAGPTVQHLQTLAQGIVDQAQQHLQAVSAQIVTAAQQLLTTMGPLAAQLGPVYQQLQQLAQSLGQ